MNLNTSALTTKDSKKAEKLLTPLLELLPFWLKDIEIEYDTSDSGGASIIVDRCYRRAQIYLTKELLTCDDKKIERYLAHEVAHVYNEPIGRVVDDFLPILVSDTDNREVLSKLIEHALETQTEDLAILFLRDDNEDN